MTNLWDTYADKVLRIKTLVNAKDADMGTSVFGAYPDVLYTYGLGPCLAVALYDSKKRQGVLAHVALTSVSRFMESELSKEQLAHTGEKVVGTLVDVLVMNSSLEIGEIEAKIVGEERPYVGVHSLKVKSSLEMWNIPLVGESLGGGAKSIIMYLDNGEIEVFELGKEPYFI